MSADLITRLYAGTGKVDFSAAANLMVEAAEALEAAQSDDPLQGAVDWFLLADGKFFCTATVQRTLRIGYNRAQRLCDIAKERAAKAGGAA